MINFVVYIFKTISNRCSNNNYHSFSGPNVCLAWLQMELCRAANILACEQALGRKEGERKRRACMHISDFTAPPPF